jgi:hypothetical protein
LSLIEKLEPGKRTTPQAAEFAQVRKVPFQPDGLPLGRVFMGAELGFCSYSGPAPQPGDVVTVVGTPENYLVLSHDKVPQRNPVFNPTPCRCKCPASSTGGQIF